MNIYQFKQINGFAHLVQKQSNTRHLSWIKQVGGRLQTEITQQLGAQAPALLTQAIAQYQAAADHEDECYLIISKSELTLHRAAVAPTAEAAAPTAAAAARTPTPMPATAWNERLSFIALSEEMTKGGAIGIVAPPLRYSTPGTTINDKRSQHRPITDKLSLGSAACYRRDARRDARTYKL